MTSDTSAIHHRDRNIIIKQECPISYVELGVHGRAQGSVSTPTLVTIELLDNYW